jgi:hypothetical protein
MLHEAGPIGEALGPLDGGADVLAGSLQLAPGLSDPGGNLFHGLGDLVAAPAGADPGLQTDDAEQE